MAKPAKSACCCPPDKRWINAGCKVHGMKALADTNNLRSHYNSGHKVKALPDLEALDTWNNWKRVGW